MADDADLQAAIEASLRECSGPRDDPATGAWDALVHAASAATPWSAPSRWGSGGGAGGTAEDDDADLAAALAASIASAEEETRRRRLGLPVAQAHAGPAPAFQKAHPGPFAALPPGPSLPLALTLPPAQTPHGVSRLGASAAAVAGVPTARHGMSSPLRRAVAAAEPRPAGAGSPCSSPARARPDAAAPYAAAAAAVAPPPWSSHSVPHVLPCLPAGRACLATAAPASAPLPGAPLLSASPGKHARTPSLPGATEAGPHPQPLPKRSRAASDSGAASLAASAAVNPCHDVAAAAAALLAAAPGAPASASFSPGDRHHAPVGAGPQHPGEGDAGAAGRWSGSALRPASASALPALDTPPERPASAASGCSEGAPALQQQHPPGGPLEPGSLLPGEACSGSAPGAGAGAGAALWPPGLAAPRLSGGTLPPLDLSRPAPALAPAVQPLGPGQLAAAVAAARGDVDRWAASQVVGRWLAAQADPAPTYPSAPSTAATLDLSRPGPALGSDPTVPSLPPAQAPLQPSAWVPALHSQGPILAAAASLPEAPVPPFGPGWERRLLGGQRVWWWLGQGCTAGGPALQAQAGRITAIDRRSSPLLYTVQLEGPAAEVVMATGDCLLPYITAGDRVMVRELLTPDLAGGPKLAARGVGDAGVTEGTEAGKAQEEGEGVCYAWVQGTALRADFVSQPGAAGVEVFLPYGGDLPTWVPYHTVVLVADAAEGSGAPSSAAPLPPPPPPPPHMMQLALVPPPLAPA
ncbi:hypothetical protein HYH03_015654 [Edaphochlamys debaryana]|uniref:Uncharacterized protein n=1 Tax=Edaphochlamys debaryana TaxID=47281 RepID=A0A836BQX6_9CHLO|nr:hypothetical protein HYH03_015654 [Edaphochlamys debaryana]|eukprot:KAG2485590.1 hypothetical protein HYH03_015654 [Edaphochlamys debaryana]